MSGSRNKAARPAYSIAFDTGSRSYRLRLPRGVGIALLLCLPCLGLIYLAATIYWIFHDDLLAALMRRQVDMQYAYEDRIGLLRHEIEAMSVRARSEEARFSTDLKNLTQRQSEAESRTALILALSERLKATYLADPKSSDDKVSDGMSAKAPTETNPLLTGAFASPPPRLPEASRAYVPGDQPMPRSLGKPHPEALELRLDNHESRNEDPSLLPPQSADDAILRLAAAYDRLDARHLRILTNMLVPANRIADTIRTALVATGLPVRDLTAAGHQRADLSNKAAVGGPFVPLPIANDGSAFARQATLLATTLATTEDLRTILPHLPLRQPFPGVLEVTSNFGPRLDPFFGRAAMHTGVDLREDYGAPVHATANGTAVFAGASGGYGNMVEIDHGGGLTSRYAHLSTILVGIGQKIDAGAIIGRIGTTGRSTGPHLHYEVRVGGEPVDPERFLKAGALLFGGTGIMAGCSAPQCGAD